MSINKEIRKLILSGKGNDIRSMLLNSDQIELLNLIDKKGYIIAKELSELYRISIQNASSKLSTLYSKGYLLRTTKSADSGGIEHVYETKL